MRLGGSPPDHREEQAPFPDRNGRRPSGGGSPWLMTFNDLITLLLTFFILIISMSTINAEKLMAVAAHFRQSFQIEPLGHQLPMYKSIVPDLTDEDIRQMRLQEERERVRRQAELYNYLSNRFKGERTQTKGIRIHLEKGGIAVVFADSLLFPPGSATLAEREPLLLKLAEIIRVKDVRVAVEGHTDNVPIATETFTSNWALSVRRAINIGQFLITDGGIEPRRLAAVGYADTRPVASNETAEGRQQNRRVSIFLTSN